MMDFDLCACTEPPSCAAQFIERATRYFTESRDNGEAATVSGLALAVGYVSRTDMADAAKSKENPELGKAIRRAVSYVESGYEAALHGAKCAGAIFALRNLGWRDDSPKQTGASTAAAVLMAAGASALLEAHTARLRELGTGTIDVEVENHDS